MNAFALENADGANILSSTAIAGPDLTGIILRLSVESDSTCAVMLFIDYLKKDFGMDKKWFSSKNIKFFIIPFKLAKCIGGKNVIMFSQQTSETFNVLGGNKSMICIFLDDFAKAAIEDYVLNEFDEDGLDHLWYCTAQRAAHPIKLTIAQIRNHQSTVYF